jgi:hypothetical protein
MLNKQAVEEAGRANKKVTYALSNARPKPIAIINQGRPKQLTHI